MSNFVPSENELGIQPIGLTSTTQNHPLGKIVRATDSTLGNAEFIYLKGVVNTAVGSLVVWDPIANTTTLAATTGNQNRPVAVAMSANVASQYGWYQIEGPAVIKKAAVKINPGVALYVNGSGAVTPTASAGKQVLNTITTNAATVASATGTVTALIQRPGIQGQVT